MFPKGGKMGTLGRNELIFKHQPHKMVNTLKSNLSVKAKADKLFECV